MCQNQASSATHRSQILQNDARRRWAALHPFSFSVQFLTLIKIVFTCCIQYVSLCLFQTVGWCYITYRYTLKLNVTDVIMEIIKVRELQFRKWDIYWSLLNKVMILIDLHSEHVWNNLHASVLNTNYEIMNLSANIVIQGSDWETCPFLWSNTCYMRPQLLKCEWCNLYG